MESFWTSERTLVFYIGRWITYPGATEEALIESLKEQFLELAYSVLNRVK